MSSRTILRGVTWNHSRALPPLVATTQRFEELHAGVEIRWEKRSLHDFGHAPLVPLTHEFDLLILDHPMMGMAYDSGTLLDLQPLLPDSFLQGLASNSVGQSYRSYVYQGCLFALPIDAAAPAASYRRDLLALAGLDLPQTWEDLVHLARKGLLVMPGSPPDIFLNFVGLCVSNGSPVAEDPEQFVDDKIGRQCLEQLRELAAGMPDFIYGWNPIEIYEQMAAHNRFAYCPFAYSYSNYSRCGFAKHLIQFTNPVVLGPDQPVRTVLGGTGLAVSKRCPYLKVALEYATYVAGEECQRTLYGLSGGQPAHRAAWVDETLNVVTHDFFRQTMACMENAYVRPRYRGYIDLQATAGKPIQNYLRGNGVGVAVLEKINALYRRSRQMAQAGSCYA